jgi:hypothetical protein
MIRWVNGIRKSSPIGNKAATTFRDAAGSPNSSCKLPSDRIMRKAPSAAKTHQTGLMYIPLLGPFVITHAKILQPEIKAQKIIMFAVKSMKLTLSLPPEPLAKEVKSDKLNMRPSIDKTDIATASITRRTLLVIFAIFISSS